MKMAHDVFINQVSHPFLPKSLMVYGVQAQSRGNLPVAVPHFSSESLD
jgi:hypothetical protein